MSHLIVQVSQLFSGVVKNSGRDDDQPRRRMTERRERVQAVTACRGREEAVAVVDDHQRYSKPTGRAEKYSPYFQLIKKNKTF